MTLAQALSDLRAARRDTIASLSGLDPGVLALPAPWRGAQADVRFLLLRLSDDDLMRRIRLEQALRGVGHEPTEAQRILGEARVLHARVAGSLIGLTEVQFHQPPANGEWPARRVLGHIIANDARYLIHVRHSVARAHAGHTGPMRPDPGTMPEASGEAESAGTMAEVLARFTAGHDAVVQALAGLADADLNAETTWLAFTFDVRFRLFRFAEHYREHLLHLDKTLAGIRFQQTEPQRLLAEAMAVRGTLEAAVAGVEEGSPAAAVAEAALRACVRDEQASVRAILTAVKGS